MIEKFFDKGVFVDRNKKNLIMINYEELLNQFSYIDFNNIYIDADTLINTNSLFCWEEFYSNINESLIFEYLNFVDNCPIQIIYTGYHLKVLLLNIFKHFSKKRIPFKTLFNLKEWTKKQLVLNVSLKNEFKQHQIDTITISQFANIFNNFKFIFNEYLNNKELELSYSYFYNYYQMLINTKDFLYIINPDQFDVRYQLTKQINKTININFQILAMFGNLLLESFMKNKQKNKFNNHKSKKIWDNTQAEITKLLYSSSSTHYDWNNPKITKLNQVEHDKLLNIDNEFEDKIITITPNQVEHIVNYQIEKSYDYIELNPNDYLPVEVEQEQENIDQNNQEEYYPTLLDSIDNINQKQTNDSTFNQEEYEKFLKGNL